MTYRVGRHVFLGARVTLAAALVATPLMASGCASTSTANDATAQAGGRGAQDTGTYPNLNIAPQVAAPQFTDDQKAAKMASLQAAQRRQGGGAGGASSDSAAMTTLARKHGADTLKAIEGKCDPIDPACN
ncbi:hypothetical protein [Aminobacter sp. BE322]|uniref:hypothetical protein n=1 Tax=unclassified Aminobacter TaxID=2644704 RepID=UPI003D196155